MSVVAAKVLARRTFQQRSLAMPAPTSRPTGVPVWTDVSTSDPERAEAFYTGLFGWTAEHTGDEFGDYVNFRKDGELVAGLIKNQQPGAPDSWTTYLLSSDAAATTAAVSANGGRVYVEPMDVGGLGTMAIVGDPTGATIGIWQPGTHAGFGLVLEPGTANWFELHTSDYDVAVPFYVKAFGWQAQTMSDEPTFRYTVLAADGRQHAGIMDAAQFLGDGVISDWQVYFHAADVDASVAKVRELGGTVTEEPQDTPYGRIAQVEDPTSAIFRLMTPPGA
jgi:predicted enzyme related to lactoylglutathione lyase